MQSEDFRAGDVVKMRSGGPDMTIKQASAHARTAFCRWFNGRALRGRVFDFDELELVKKADAKPT